MLFPSTAAATRCLNFLAQHTLQSSTVIQSSSTASRDNLRIVDLVFQNRAPSSKDIGTPKTIISAVIFSRRELKNAKTFWQHSGDGVSSRRAEFCFKAFEEGYMAPRNHVQPEKTSLNRMCKGPRRYQRKASLSQTDELTSSSMMGKPSPMSLTSLDRQDYAQFVEERFGRNLDLSLAANAKLAVRRRIAGSLTANVDLPEAIAMPNEAAAVRKVQGFSEDDIYLYPCGMSSIFNTHRIMLKARGPLKSISFG